MQQTNNIITLMYAVEKMVIIAVKHSRKNGMDSKVKRLFHQRNLLIVWSFQPLVDHLVCQLQHKLQHQLYFITSPHPHTHARTHAHAQLFYGSLGFCPGLPG